MSRSLLLALTLPLAACDPVSTVTGTVRISPTLRARYDLEAPALVNVMVPEMGLLTVGALCDATKEELTVPFELSDIGCSRPSTATAWITELDDAVPACDAERMAQMDPLDPTRAVVIDEEDVFRWIDPEERCTGEIDDVQLSLGT